MASSLGQLVLVAGLAFLVLAAHGGPSGGGGPAIGAAAAASPPPPAREAAIVISQHHPPQPPLLSAAAVTVSKLVLIPPSGPSDRWNYEVNHEKPAVAESGSGRRRTRAIAGGRRLGYFP